VDVEGSDDNLQKSCANLASHIFDRQAQSPQRRDRPHIPTGDRLLFGGIDSAIDTVDTAISALNDSSSNTVDSEATLEMWRGNIGAALNLVTSSRGLNDKISASSDFSTWTALSVLAGRDVWKSMMEVQGQALISRGDIHNGVLHLLAAEQAEAAVGAYREAGMFHEALTLAKLRLGDDDKIVTDLYVDYAASLEKKREFTTATKCYLAAGLPQKALQTLIRRGDLDAFKQAYEISCLSAEGGDHSLAALCGCQCQALGEWDAASSYYLRHDELVAYVVFLSTEEAFRSEVPAMGWHEHVKSSWKRYRMKQVTVPTFRATVWTYDPRLQAALGQALLQLAEHTLSVAAGDASKESRQNLLDFTSENPDISESDARRFAEIIENWPAS
jgi:tetratricopeptide (TPR) repeat protein